MNERAEVLIVGGGIIGSSVAWALATQGVGGVVVVDLDLAGVYASSELNAGGARATWWHPVNIESCRATLGFFRDHGREFGFRELGYLWLYSDEDLWAHFLNSEDVDWVVVRDHARDLIYEGWVQAFSVTSPVREIVLYDVKVYSNEGGKHLYDVPAMYVAAAANELALEMPAEEKEQDDGGEEAA